MTAASASEKRPVSPGLLRGNGQFRLFWSARAVSFIGDGVATIALVLYVNERQDSGLAVAGVLLASSVPRLLGPLAGTIVDRLPPIPLMVGCDLGQAVVYLSIAAVRPPLPLLLVLVVCASLLATLFRPAGSGLVPRLVAPEQLLQANSWVGFALNLQLACGPPLGALAFQQLGIRGALTINAGTFLASAALLFRLRRFPVENARDDLPDGFMTEFRRGLSFVFGDRLLRIVVLTLFGSVLFAAVDNVALVFLARNDLHANAIGYGAVAAVYGAGMVAAALTLTRFKRSPSPIAVFIGGPGGTGSSTRSTQPTPTKIIGRNATGTIVVTQRVNTNVCLKHRCNNSRVIHAPGRKIKRH